MRQNLDACMEIIFGHEGGYVDHPDDPGGATNWGITHKTLAAWRNVDRVTPEQVRALTLKEATEIYAKEYWRPIRGDDLPGGVDLVAFDMGINAGPARSARILQRIVGVTADGVIGAQTLAAVRSRDPGSLIHAFSDARLAYYKSLEHWPTFGRGWTRRTEETRLAALDLSRQKVPRRPSRGGDTGKAPDAMTSLFQRIVNAIISALPRLFR